MLCYVLAMFIQRIVIRDLRALREIDHEFTLWSGQRAPLACLQGLNGSGKTTYLEAIAALWDSFRVWVETRGPSLRSEGRLLREAGLCAMHITDLPGPASSLWLIWGQCEMWKRVPNRGTSLPIGVVVHGRRELAGLLQDQEEPLRQDVTVAEKHPTCAKVIHLYGVPYWLICARRAMDLFRR